MAKLFRTSRTESASAETPALLFHDLKRDPTIKFLWGHQEKILDTYYIDHRTARDLALELPTGTGKTLVGLLIGEFRRQANKERIAFLCSTKQLCAQVHRQSKKYGIPTSLLIGPQNSYDHAAFFSYQQSRAIAVTTYTGLFNTNPRINDPQVIICDDAHAGESLIGDMWTLRITKREHLKLFDQLFSILKTIMSENAAFRIKDDASARGRVVELVSPIALNEVRSHIVDAVAAFLDEYETLSYPWKLIRSHLESCNLYCSADTFEFRPLLVPTLTHLPFANAKQRIFMSATLGEDGDLERCFGLKRVERLPIPRGWDKRGTGRRLVLFPQMSGQSDKELLAPLLERAQRTLLLVPNNTTRDRLNKALVGVVEIFVSGDADENIETFRTSHKASVLILANRYDGIDFPGDECRNVIVFGLPLGASLQETFLTQRLKAISVTRDRVRTRITQAMGRCTRDESDYSIVLIYGEDLTKWFCTSENIVGMHPELQAEIAFGMENSINREAETFLALCVAFLDRSPEWDDAEVDIKAQRARLKKIADPGAASLQTSVPREIDYTYSLWNGQYGNAYKAADSVLAKLSGGEEMRAYRCLWEHQAAVAAFLAWKQEDKDSFRLHAIRRLENAAKGNFGIQWLSELAGKLGGQIRKSKETVDIEQWFSPIEELLEELGLTGPKFDKQIAEKRQLIAATDADNFHQGLAFLGKMLGAVTHVWKGVAKPDVFWRFGTDVAFVFEAKTEEAADGSIGANAIRQALTHEKSARSEHRLPPFTPCYTVIVSPRTSAEKSAKEYAEDLFYCDHKSLIKLFGKAADALTELRILAPDARQELLLDEAKKTFRKHDVSFESVKAFLVSRKVVDLPETKSGSDGSGKRPKKAK